MLAESEVVAGTNDEEHHDKKEGEDPMEEEEKDGTRERATNPESTESYFNPPGNFSCELTLPNVGYEEVLLLCTSQCHTPFREKISAERILF